MYVEPSWIELLINGIVIDVVFLLIAVGLAFGISKLIIPKIKNALNINDETEIKVARIILIVILTAILVMPFSIVADSVWSNVMEKPSVREDTITIYAIQPRPGAVKMNNNGYYIDNSNQLMFITQDGKEFENTENWNFNKFETRTIFNKLKVYGTYRIKYYGWRNGHSNEFPNILSVEEVINENGTQPNDFNKYFGAHYGNRAYDLEMTDQQ